ncbi:MAG: ABC transporter ATP-binding protein, partial [Victivallaceae bacterium]
MKCGDDESSTLLRRSLQNNYKSFFLLPILGVVSLGAGVLLPDTQKKFIDALLNRSASVWWSLGLVVLLMSVVAAGQWGINWWGGKCSEQVFKRMKLLFAQKLLEMPCEFFLRHPSGYLTARLELDTANSAYFYSYEYFAPYLGTLSMLGAWIILCCQSWHAGILTAVALGMQVLILRRLMPKNYALHQESSELSAGNYGTLHQFFSNIERVKTQVGEGMAIEKITKSYEKSLFLALKMLKLQLNSGILLRIAPVCTKLILLLAGIWEFRQGNWSAGEIWAVVMYANLVFAPAAGVFNNLMSRSGARAALQRVEQLYRLIPEAHLQDGIELNTHIKLIKFAGVSFGYDETEMIIKDCSFEFKRGELTAVIGRSGSGKSTLISLLLQLYVPQRGEIYYNECLAEKYNLRSLRRHIGYVSQSPQFFAGSLLDNLGKNVTRVQ